MYSAMVHVGGPGHQSMLEEVYQAGNNIPDGERRMKVWRGIGLLNAEGTSQC